ncbi:MAG TPA: hypothetical protein VHQ64_10970 [Pyrinomonadaceae bacterium]|jgi:hypothetical protein|nr:hypothetical protein [Pyrinomonadaceae bacterium]
MLTVLETASQVEWFSKTSPTKNSQVVAVTPTAAYACQQLAIPYLKIEDHCQYGQRSVEYTDLLNDYLKWEAWLDEWALNAIPEFSGTGFKPANAVTFLLQLLLAEIWATSANLREFLRALAPSRISGWPPNLASMPWFLQPGVSPAAVLFPSVAATHGIEFIDLSSQAPELRPSSDSESSEARGRTVSMGKAKNYVRQNGMFTVAEAVIKHGPAVFYRRVNGTRKRIMLSGHGYDLEPLAQDLLRRGVRLRRLRDNTSRLSANATAPQLKDLTARLAHTGSELLREPELWKQCKAWGVDQTPLLSQPLLKWWQHLVPTLWLHFQNVSRQLRNNKYEALITMDCGGSTWGGPAVQAASALNVHRYTYQHGGSAGRDARTWQMYLRGSDTFLTAGEGTRRDLEESRPPFLTPFAKIVPVGSGMLDKLRSGYSETKARRLRDELKGRDPRPIVLYIPTTFGQYGRAIADIAPYAEVSYLELQQEALRVWLEAPDVRLLYKNLVVANDPTRVMPDFIQKQIPNGTVTTRRLTDLMWAVDAIIVDHAVTALNEVLLTNKPMVVYLPPMLTLDPAATTILQKRATVAETPGDFINAIREFLRPQRFSTVQSPNNDFLSLYGTFLNDGQSTQRAAAVILEGPHREFRRTQL